MDNIGSGNTKVQLLKINKPEIIDQILNNVLISKKNILIVLYPSEEYFKSYLIEITKKSIIIDSLMPFEGNKKIISSKFLKIGIGTGDDIFERYFLTNYINIISIDDNDYNFEINKPKEVIFIEKRKALRVSTDDSNTVYISFLYNKNILFYKVYDLSAEGLAFDSDIKFEQGIVFKNVLIKLENYDFKLDIKIMHSTYINTNGKYRTGVMFIDIPSKILDKIINFMLALERSEINSDID
jgi:c-di-GMP-binding flagellar brake protein YcgR